MPTMPKLPRRVAKTLPDVRPEHLACRDYGHAWAPFTAAWNASERAYHVQLRCGRCGTVRTRTLDRYGSLVANHYTYADGYLVPGSGRFTGAQRDAIRLASIHRLIDATNENVEG